MDSDAVTSENQPGEIGRHARDYSKFLTMLKWGAIIAFIAAFFVVLLIS
jgi:hypothetical protein